MMTSAAFAVRALADAEQRAHAEFGHRRLVENFHFDAELFELLGAIGEFFGVKDIGRLVDERAGDQDAFGHRLARFRLAPRSGRVLDGDGDLAAAPFSSSSFFFVL